MVLAAGAGRRFGGPKALARTDGVPWVVRAVGVLRDLEPVLVVVGAAADDVVAVLPNAALAVRNDDWDSGMGSSLRAGLATASTLPEDVAALVVMLVDLPGVTSAMVRAIAADADRKALRQAVFDGVPGHPVLLGRDHWAGVAAADRGDSGGRDYLMRHGAVEVPLGSAADGADVDTAPR